jgi:type II secretory pathway component PulM
MSGLTARERRLVAILILVAIVAGIWFALVAPIFDGFADRREQRAAMRETIHRNERLIAATPALRRAIERQRPDAGRVALSAPSTEAASDLLRQRLQRSFVASGGEVSGVSDTAARPGWVAAAAEGAMSLDQLTKALADLQAQPPYLVISRLDVVADRAFQSGKLDLLNVKFDVTVRYSQAS